MAERRMFSKKVIDCDRFTALPHRARLLYFYLALEADDDGFFGNAATLLRGLMLQRRDLDALCESGYIIMFEDGVGVIAHWRVSNAVRKDRYHPTVFTRERELLELDESGVYRLLGAGDGDIFGNQMATEERVGQVRSGQVSSGEAEEGRKEPSPAATAEAAVTTAAEPAVLSSEDTSGQPTDGQPAAGQPTAAREEAVQMPLGGLTDEQADTVAGERTDEQADSGVASRGDLSSAPTAGGQPTAGQPTAEGELGVLSAFGRAAGEVAPPSGTVGDFTPPSGTVGDFTPPSDTSGDFAPPSGTSGDFTPQKPTIDHVSPAPTEDGQSPSDPPSDTSSRPTSAFKSASSVSTVPTKSPSRPTGKHKSTPDIPTLDDLRSYARRRGLTHVNIDHFYRHYSDLNWLTASGSFVRWKLRLADWDREDQLRVATPTPPRSLSPSTPSRDSNFTSSFDTDDFFAAALRRSYAEFEKT